MRASELKRHRGVLLTKKQEIVEAPERSTAVDDRLRTGDWVDHSSQENDLHVNLALKQTDTKLLRAIDEATDAAEAASPPAKQAKPSDTRERLDLTSGEILKGNLVILRDGKVDFDSSELDDVTVDWRSRSRARRGRSRSRATSWWPSPRERGRSSTTGAGA